MHQRDWVELLNDYECEIRYYPEKANVVVDALSHKEHANSVRLVCSQILTDIENRIRETQHISVTEKDLRDELSCGVETKLESMSNGLLLYLNRMWILDRDDLRTFFMNEAHKSRYSIHLGVDKMYHDL